MEPIILSPLTKELEIEIVEQPVQLSVARKREIESFWVELNQEKTFHRGEVFNVCSAVEQDDVFKVRLNLTDYAHYLHTVRNGMDNEESCKVIYGAGMVETTDSVLVFGEMGDQTAYPRRLQCVGGGLSHRDRIGNKCDIKQSVLRELNEELGINYHETVRDCLPTYISTKGTYDFIVIIYHIKLNIDSQHLEKQYQVYCEKLIKGGEEPEFQNLIYLHKNNESITCFIKNDHRPSVDYLKPYLEKVGEKFN